MRMTTSEPDANVVPLDPGATPEDPLPYTVELCQQGNERSIRVIGRAANIMLARAIYEAAQTDFAGKTIRLRRGPDVLAQSAP
jgi:hypothetical protein